MKILSRIFKVHEYEANFKMPCFYCPQLLKSIKAYDQHVRKCETNCQTSSSQAELNEKKVENGPIWQCNFCQEIFHVSDEPNLEDFSLVSSHCFKHSKFGPIACPVCDVSYNTYQVFVNHIKCFSNLR